MQSKSEIRPTQNLPSIFLNSKQKSVDKLRKFELFKQLYEATTNNEDYKKMRRPIKPSLPVYMYSRYENSKFYHENSYYYPRFKKPVEWTVLLTKRHDEYSTSSSSMS
ncbi:hypothetical protein BpHYR1_046855 [Brachionus plicatilis]|uniref:Uncharacterized protein n=1 Tax=Brachionus plicatilis TaxID=10195 RepID=A0A3M7RG39_BRAPC|nr:hypothetical protein BpHYR1_046855 [Brachionus plicatilis]